ncbi:hypothetical protein MESS4_20050 [Mesorhizobium sp. STM 4661]|nr:hypothetical protein MESS4_20050 [Mesorhizobium sp. STM 4661]
MYVDVTALKGLFTLGAQAKPGMVTIQWPGLANSLGAMGKWALLVSLILQLRKRLWDRRTLRTLAPNLFPKASPTITADAYVRVVPHAWT